MDPNANLAEQRRILARVLAVSVSGTLPYTTDERGADLERLAELVQALDEWISKGGFLPAAWRK